TGLALVMRQLDGTDPLRLIVRAEGRTIAAGGYAVLGDFLDPERPTFVDYGFAEDLPNNLYAGAAVTLESCGTVLDTVIYRDLPSAGTLGFDGARPPDAAANDDAKNWCADPNGTGAGTPRERNRPCAP